MASFDIAYNISARHEGGYTNNPNDAGNWTGGKVNSGVLVGTNWGIAAPTFASYLNRIPTVADMKNMSASTAKAIYKINFWDKIKLGDIKDQQVANIIFDAYINQTGGTGWMIRKALGDDVSFKLGMSVGDQVPRINAVAGKTFFEAFKAQRKAYYERQNNPTFIKGWLNRLSSFTYETVETLKKKED